jgi:hypothetical protein
MANERAVSDDDEPKRPFWAKCGSCNHCWPAAYLPMEMGRAGKLLKGLLCPMCAAGPGRILIAKQDNGILQEVA